MKRQGFPATVGLVFLLIFSATGVANEAEDAARQAFEAAKKLQDDGKFAEAMVAYEKILFGEDADNPVKNVALLECGMQNKDVCDCIQWYNFCLQRLNKASDADAFLEKIVTVYGHHWPVLESVARTYAQGLQHNGFVVSGQFQRGRHRGGGQFASCYERDRVRALQLMQQCLPLVQKMAASGKLDDQAAAGWFYLRYADFVLTARQNPSALWELQTLTNLDTLPDYDTDNPYGRYSAAQGAPVDAEGNPVFYAVPASLEAAKNDGELWRWCLDMAVKSQPDDAMANCFRTEVNYRLANFAQQQFSVQTLASYGFRFQMSDDTALEDEQKKGGILTLHTLADNETVAKLATGVKRFELPDDYNYIKLYETIADSDTHRKFLALQQLASIKSNRRQYPAAAGFYKRILDEYKDGQQPQSEAFIAFATAAQQFNQLVIDSVHLEGIQQQYDQIVKNWGRFEGAMPEKAAGPTSFPFRYRNATKVKFTATRINLDLLFADTEAMYRDMEAKSPFKNSEQREEWNRNLQHFGNVVYVLVHQNKTKYLTDEKTDWSLDLKPAKNHFDRTLEVKTPMTAAGAYLLESEVEDGNTTYMVMWVSDMVLTQKRMDNAMWYYVADAATGKAIPGAKISAFGYRQEHSGDGKVKVTTKALEAVTDENGQWVAKEQDLPQNYYTMMVARKPGVEPGANESLAFLGFNHYGYSHANHYEYGMVKVFPMTDRPVYRPNQKVNFKFWVDRVGYDRVGKSPFADLNFILELHTPRGEKIDLPEVTADQWGGCAGEYLIPADATLGQYQLVLRNGGNTAYGAATFRIEEYKKPEFEVTVDAPTEPVMLGEKIEAKITAKYYFGSPVTKGTVKYKVMRTSHTQSWYAPAPWDWYYGPGYWWNAYDTPWLRGWSFWGCKRPMPTWWHSSYEQPEVVMEKEVTLSEDADSPDMLEPGVIRVEFDTALAKELYPNSDHRYSITAEVVDESRRTITGSGDVLVARQPFRVFAWTNRAYYRTGDTVTSSFQSRTLNDKPVTGTGVYKVFRVTYDAKGTPVETEVYTKDLAPNPEGRVEHKLTMRAAGQYRVSYTLTDKAGHAIEGGQMITVTGDNFVSNDLRFNDLELIPDKSEYAPGETVKLMINTNLADATVVLFMRAHNGVCFDPVTIAMDGKSKIVDVPVKLGDMPNFFVEAVTVSGARVYSETKEICVPPAERVLAMEIVPDKMNYLPGEKAKAKIRLTGPDGKPFTGTTVVTIYDKSLEYIAGGSNVPNIKEFFWKWRRNHYPQTVSSTQKWSHEFTPTGKPGMSNLGVFGHVTANMMDISGVVAMEDAEMDMAMDGAVAYAAVPAVMSSAAMPAKSSLRKSESAAHAMADAAPMDALAFGGKGGRGLMEEKAKKRDSGAADKPGEGPGGGAESEALVEPTVRSNFADTALWVSSLETDQDGMAEIELDMPENLTTWMVRAWALGDGARVGSATAEVITRKNLILRMQTPRFLITGDEILLTANVHNYLDTEKSVTVALDIPESSMLEPLDDLSRTVTVSAGGEARVDWRVRAKAEGECVVQMKALTDEESDAMQMAIPIRIHGMMKQLAFSGMIRADANEANARGVMKFDVPAARRVDESALIVRFSPTLAGAMIDALPYLVDYPYGCTEQTLNRFLPTVLVQKTLIDMGVSLADVRDKETNLNAQEIGNPKERAAQWSRNHQTPNTHRKLRNPVFDEAEVAKMTAAGVERLTNMQCSDGGWGWFSGYGERSSAHLTAIVTRGLMLARGNDVAVGEGVIERGIQWLENYQKEELRKLERGKAEKPVWPYKTHADNVDALVYMVLAEAGLKPDNRGNMRDMSDQLYADRLLLSRYSLAIIGVAYAINGESEKMRMVVENLSQFLVVDEENQTAWLDLGNDCPWWYWYGSENETQAMYLRLLCLMPRDFTLKIRTRVLPEDQKPAENLDGQVIAAVRPKDESKKEFMAMFQPMELAPQLVKYLLNNRKNAVYWESTRDTANVVEAMAQYLKASGEMNPEMTVEVLVNGEVLKTVEVTKDNLFTLDNTLVLAASAVKTGPYEIEIRRKGAGPVYYNAYFSYFSLEDFITKAGLEVKVERKYYKLVRVEGDRAEQNRAGSRGQVTQAKVEKYDRMPLAVGATVTSGDLVEVELSIESKNDYTYLIFEDMKPAGFEPVEVRSGYSNNAMRAYVEYRDDRVAFFVQNLARGEHSVSYRMRAEQPGSVSALPTRAAAMYAPELKANSDEMKIKTVDKQ